MTRPRSEIPAKPGLVDYKYVATNLDATPFSSPLFQIRAHSNCPLRAYLTQVTAASIRNTVLTVSCRAGTNGYDLTAAKPIPYGCYLLLVRDRSDPQWRASGYFRAGANRDPVRLHADPKGMMHEGQGPIAMPEVYFLRDVIEPEFTAGWGEDSDGDGLPDIYEVLVTQTDPADPDTGGTGILDGYKDPDGDGWSNLEEFRRRTNPLRADPAPPPAELSRPTIWEAMQATMPQSDLKFEPVVAIRRPGSAQFEPLLQPLEWILATAKPRDPRTRLDFDLRVTWRVNEFLPRARGGYSGP